MNVAPIVGFCNYSVFCCALLSVHSSFSIILMGKRESRDCSVSLSRGATGLSAVVVVVSPDHSHLLFSTVIRLTLGRRCFLVTCVETVMSPLCSPPVRAL